MDDVAYTSECFDKGQHNKLCAKATSFSQL